MRVELHCHSTASDGVLTPGQLVERAAQREIGFLALTDHDTTAGYRPAAVAAEAFDMEVIPGIEISCHAGGREVHVLGYFYDVDDEPLQNMLARMRDSRLERVDRLLERLDELELPLTREQVLAQAAGTSVGRPHVADAMIEAGYVKNRDQAFDNYLGKGKPAFMPRQNLTVKEAVERLNEAGGVAVLAHPHLIGDIKLVAELLDLGFAGIEVWHPSHGRKEVKRYRRLARSRRLVPTGGSDFHIPEDSGRPDLGSMKVSSECVEALRERSKARA